MGRVRPHFDDRALGVALHTAVDHQVHAPGVDPGIQHELQHVVMERERPVSTLEEYVVALARRHE